MIFAARRRRASGLASAVELTPLIDVVLLLLIFFMVSTSFLRREALAVTLPDAAAGRAAAPADEIVVQIGAAGEYIVQGERLASTEREALAAALSAWADTSAWAGAERPLRIAADRDARHQAVVRALDAASQAGFVHVQLATRPLDDEPRHAD